MQDYFDLQLDMQYVPYSLAIIAANLVQYMLINFMGGKHRNHFN